MRKPWLVLAGTHHCLPHPGVRMRRPHPKSEKSRDPSMDRGWNFKIEPTIG